MATLTGAQLIATGMHHAGIMANSAEWEDAVYAAGQRSGDWCFPLLYAPELLMKEFDSKVADMKNSVKVRTNAQSSCAGHFVESHIQEDWQGQWCHIDIAGPSFRAERATGFGAALVIEVAKQLARTE
jgi:probable aminopeptidase NPEPL1